jgi:hypothetical protein
MKRAAPLVLLLLAGCSTAPVADVLDFFAPGRARVGQTPPYGGVCIPQGGSIVAPTVPAASGTPPPPAPPTPLIPAPGGGGVDVPATRPF